MVAQLVVRKVRASRADHVPPGSSTNSAGTDVGTDGHVTEEEPASDQALRGATWRLVHDVQVGGVEAEGSGGQTVSNQVDPEELHGDQSFGQAEGSSQENTHNLQIVRMVSVNASELSDEITALPRRCWKKSSNG